MEIKRFYRVIYKEYLAGCNISHYYNASRLHYGVPHIDIDSTMYSKCDENGYPGYIKTLDYDQFKDAIKHGEIRSNDFEVRKSFFLRKEYIYQCYMFQSWIMLFETGPYYLQKYYINIEQPSITALREELPADEYIEWCSDNGIKLSEKAIINL